MKVIFGANKKFELFFKNLKRQVEDLGYETMPYNFGGLGEGIDWPYEFPELESPHFSAKIPIKPDIIKDALERTKDDIVYMDCDIEVLKDFSEVWEEDFDIGVTARVIQGEKLKEFMTVPYPNLTGYLNAGVIFARYTKRTLGFIKSWKRQMEDTEWGSDQEALTMLLKKKLGDNWERERSYKVAGAQVYLFPTEIYNWSFWGVPYSRRGAKAIHYTGIYHKTLEKKIKEKCSQS